MLRTTYCRDRRSEAEGKVGWTAEATYGTRSATQRGTSFSGFIDVILLKDSAVLIPVSISCINFAENIKAERCFYNALFKQKKEKKEKIVYQVTRCTFLTTILIRVIITEETSADNQHFFSNTATLKLTLTDVKVNLGFD